MCDFSKFYIAHKSKNVLLLIKKRISKKQATKATVKTKDPTTATASVNLTNTRRWHRHTYIRQTNNSYILHKGIRNNKLRRIVQSTQQNHQNHSLHQTWLRFCLHPAQNLNRSQYIDVVAVVAAKWRMYVLVSEKKNAHGSSSKYIHSCTLLLGASGKKIRRKAKGRNRQTQSWKLKLGLITFEYTLVNC